MSAEENKVEQTEMKSVEEQKEQTKEEMQDIELNGEEKTDDIPEKTDKSDTDEKTPESKETKEEKKVEPAKPLVHKPDFEQDIVYIYQLGRHSPVIPSISFFCLKLETWVRLAGVKYENVDHKSRFASKKGSFPFVELNGEEINTKIIDTLAERMNADLDAALTEEQKQLSYITKSMIENHLIFAHGAWKVKNPTLLLQAYDVNLPKIMGRDWPLPILKFFFNRKVKNFIGKRVPKNLTNEEIADGGKSDLRVLSSMLGEQQYFFGEAPTTLDAVAFASLAQILYCKADVEAPLRGFLEEECQNLKQFCDRIKEKAFPDWDEMLNTLDLNPHLPKPPKEEEQKKEEAVPLLEAEEKTEKVDETDAKEDEKKPEEEEKVEEKEAEEKTEKDQAPEEQAPAETEEKKDEEKK